MLMRYQGYTMEGLVNKEIFRNVGMRNFNLGGLGKKIFMSGENGSPRKPGHTSLSESMTEWKERQGDVRMRFGEEEGLGF